MSMWRWESDPNRVAADLYRGLTGKPRERLRQAIETVNAWPHFGKRKADPERVRELLRRNRGRRPYDPILDDPNGYG